MARSTPASRPPRVYLLLTIFLVVAALYFASDVLIPLALALLLSFLLAPVVNRAEHLRIGRPAAVAIVALLAFTIIAILSYVVADQVIDLASNIDQYKGNIITKIQKLRPNSGLMNKLERTAKEIQEKVDEPTTQSNVADERRPAAAGGQPDGKHGERVDRERTARTPALDDGARRFDQPSASPIQTLAGYLRLVLGPLGTFGIVIVFVVFMLLEREDLRNRLLRLVGQGQLTLTTQALDDASSRISRYLVAQAIVNGTYGAAIAMGLWLIGLSLGDGTPFPSVLLWGLLCALLRFIPYIGPWIASAFPLAVAFAVFPGFGVFAASVALFVVIELISNNVLEPMLYGSSTGMSTLAILVSAVFWTWLWGPIGLLLSTPLTVVLVVLGKYVPQLQFLDVMLGDDPVLTPAERMYQRLLALDPEEATELARDDWEKGSLESLYDTVLIPALGMAEQDRHAGQLDDRRDKFIRQTIRDIIDELGDEERTRATERDAAAKENGDAKDNGSRLSAPGNGPDAVTTHRVKLPRNCAVNVLCLPAHDEADEICNLMLAQLLELRGFCPFTLGQNSLASEMIEEVDKRRADLVVISALPPSAVAHARYLSKRLTARFPDGNLLIGLWLSRLDTRRIKQRIRCGEVVGISTTMADILNEISQRAAALTAGRTASAPALDC